MWRSERDQFPPSNQIAIKPQGYFDRIMFWNAETAGLFFVRQAASNAQPEFRVEGANAFLAVLLPMAVLALVLPNYLISVPGPFYSPFQLYFVSAACLGLYIAFLFIQTNWHRVFFC